MGWKFGKWSALLVMVAPSLCQAVEKDGAWIINDWQAAREIARAGKIDKPIFVVFR
jgi:hypothetical protein